MGLSENVRKAKFYPLTADGRRRLRHEVSTWDALRCGGGQDARRNQSSCSRRDGMKPTPLWWRHARFFGPDPGAGGKTILACTPKPKFMTLSPGADLLRLPVRMPNLNFATRASWNALAREEKMERRERLKDPWSDRREGAHYTLRTLGREPDCVRYRHDVSLSRLN